MTPHERAYRRLLLLLPRAHRAAWGEDMVATYLDRLDAQLPEGATDEDRALVSLARPGPRDAADVALLAVRLRLGLESPAPRTAPWAAALRILALAGLLVQAALALVDVPGLLLSLRYDLGIATSDVVLSALVGLAWVGAYVCAVLHRVVPARTLAVVAWLVPLAPVLAQLPAVPFLAPRVVDAVGVGLPVLLLWTHAPDAPAPSRRWLPALPAAAVAALVALWSSRYAPDISVWDRPGLWCLGVVLAALVLLGTRTGDVAPVLALALGGAVAAVLRLAAVPGEPYATTVQGQALVAALVAVSAGAVAARWLRAIPVVPASSR